SAQAVDPARPRCDRRHRISPTARHRDALPDALERKPIDSFAPRSSIHATGHLDTRFIVGRSCATYHPRGAMRTVRNELISIRYVLTALSLLALAQVRPARAFNYVTDATGTWWGIQDAAPPRVDTGSIRATQTGPGDCLFNNCVTPPYSTS